MKKLYFLFIVFFVPFLNFAKNRPNIIFLMADDQSFYTLGCYGNKDVHTPQIDKLAEDGMIFMNHYATTAICMASRATVMTGKFEYKTGCNFEHGDMLETTWQKSYPMVLKEAGYRIGFAGKFGFCIRRDPQSKKLPLPENDFDKWAGAHGQSSYKTKANSGLSKYAQEYPHSTLAYGAFGCDFIEESKNSDQPFCLSISFKAPHKPADPDPRFNQVYQGDTFTKPGNFGRAKGVHFSEQSRQDRQYERFTGWGYDQHYDERMAVYHQQVFAIDKAVGMIRESLKQTGADENTVIIYTSDNGYFCGSHGYASKVLPYEESSRVPMIIFDPRSKNSGKKIHTEALTGNCDFAPTMLTLAGLPIQLDMDGKNLMGIYEQPENEIHEFLPLINVWGHPATHSLSVVTKDYKYIHWGYAAKGFSPTDEFYNTTDDPLELVNLVGTTEEEVELKKKYDSILEQWKEECVEYNGYQSYGVLFDRFVPWNKKESLIKKLPIAISNH